MSTQLPPVPYQNPIVDQNGNVTPGWGDWFKQVFARVGTTVALTNTELANLFPVATANIADGSITSNKLASGSVGSTALASGAVGNAALAANAVLATNILNGIVNFAKLVTTDWTSSQAASGYQKLGSGLYIQWGVTTSIATGTNTAITFPIAFPTTCFQVIAGMTGNGAALTTATGQWGTASFSTTGFTLNNRTSIASTFNYFAVGN